MRGAQIRDLPRRDDVARERLVAVGMARAPVVLARDRALDLSGTLGSLLPTVQRGSVVAVGGPVGSGAIAAVLQIAAAATMVGEWAAMVDGGGTLGGLAAEEAGVDLARFAVVRDVPRDRWATVVAALLDGVSVVIAELPHSVRVGDARRLVARARERAAVLVTVAPETRAWPVEAAVRIHTRAGRWTGLGAGDGVLESRAGLMEIEGRGLPRRDRLELVG